MPSTRTSFACLAGVSAPFLLFCHSSHLELMWSNADFGPESTRSDEEGIDDYTE
jgi:hypothetical protein